MTTPPHQTVLLEEAVRALMTNPGGSYVDCTYGRGGHSQAIADSLNPEGRLLVMDRDEEAVAHAQARFRDDRRVIIEHACFSQLKHLADSHRFEAVDGVLMDLGVSSPQLDEAERGFSFQRSGPLDMRMNRSEGPTAAEWLAKASEREITDVLKQYGEERFARRIAGKIVATREDSPIDTTDKLVEVVETSIPGREKHKHPATRTFQAIRIQVNRELEELQSCLADVVELLNSGGRLVVISFHSLEDRIVKGFFRRMAQGAELPSRLPVRDADIARYFRIRGKPIRPSGEEVAGNRRARSSIMRVAEKL